jgi:hypothetical protein
LRIDHSTAERFRGVVRDGFCGMKPGWCRVGLHWVMDDAEADHVIDAVHFVAHHGYLFLSLYDFDLYSGTWTHRNTTDTLQQFSLDAALDNDDADPALLTLPVRRQLYDYHMTEANRWAERLKDEPAESPATLQGELGDLQFFSLPANAARQH